MGLYEKPVIKTYSADDLLEELGPSQSQYSSPSGSTQGTTLYTTTGNSTVNVDGEILGSAGLVTTAAGIYVGDTSSDTFYRGFVGFDISSLSGQTIVSATLRVYQNSLQGTPYTDLGNVLVDHVNFGSFLDVGDFDAAALTSNIGTISTSSTIEWKTLGVASYVQTDINAGRTSSQFRLRFSTDTNSDGNGDIVRLESAENFYGTGNTPELVITYN